ncbi:MAG: DNA-formamidopyrimidine glycosylase, partial [Myxococcales bacterium]|nr:DNA-formamidopyrimidine glycosylase [Myxococcales bacterium]
PEADFTTRIPGQHIRSVRRRGKHLLFDLESDCLLVHLGMTGQMTFWDQNASDASSFYVSPTTGLQRTRQHAVDKHTHLSFWFADGNAMHYRDIRQFGKIRLFPLGEESRNPPISNLGPEPLEPGFTFDDFSAALKRTKRSIKAALLDQGIVAGLGNIYVDEALFVAKLRPTWLCSALTTREKRALFEAIPQVLEQGIRFNGTSLRDYVNSEGERGSNQEMLWVYGRYGEACRVCGDTIVRATVAQRTSSYCPTCQSR